VPHKKRIALLVKKEGKIGLIQRKERFLHGLWGFAQKDDQPKDAIILGNTSHTYSHFKLSLTFVTCKEAIEVDGWFDLEAIEHLALSKVDEKLLALLLKSDLSYTED
jgi:A/G-specific adenine glycosylase